MSLPFDFKARLARAALTLLLAWGAARLCVRWGVPVPWMIGPLLATALANSLGLPAHSLRTLRNIGQWTIAVVLGLYFTPEMGALMLRLWWAVLLGVVWALLLGLGLGRWLRRALQATLPGLAPAELRATSYFASSIGAASEMTLLAERAGARTDLVAAAHSVRMAVVVLSVPFLMQWAKDYWQLQAVDMAPPAPRVAEWPGLLWLVLATGAGAALMRLARGANPWFIGPLAVTVALTLSGIHWSAVPTHFSQAAQLLIGVSLGVRFSRAFWVAAPRWLAATAVGALALIALCLGFGAVLAWATGLHPMTLVLATSPGGLAEMAITAQVLQLGAPVVTAFQVCRLVAVLLLAEPVYRRWVAPIPPSGMGTDR
ncbi:MAG TPA: AbrB family transcriptional regulator [Ottowia sp.]|uniref:AbrB family transcriptional regulator n=1 Tax=Ottowia sp. TaxID=1898956 RepID=UPI002C1E8F8D|nr:AbrB family transcriptional regulator [Ottowia sp.]HMN22004.1 AbrB family transcriptional regulator [Ottowia sp.]